MIKDPLINDLPILRRLLENDRPSGYIYPSEVYCPYTRKRKRRDTDTDTLSKNINKTQSKNTKPVRFGRVPKNEKERIKQAMQLACSTSTNGSQHEYNEDFLIKSITKSHLATSTMANDSVRQILRKAEEQTSFIDINPLTNCPLNPFNGGQDFSDKFSPIVREVVNFAKHIPGFIDVRHEDKITLLRACVFEVLVIRFSSLVDAKNKRIIAISGCMIKASIYSDFKASNDFVNSLFTFVERINSLSLSEEEVALFTAAIVVNPKRIGLNEASKIASMHKKIVGCLQMVMQRDRPGNPTLCQELMGTLNDLWILNGMHGKLAPSKSNYNNPSESNPIDIPNRNSLQAKYHPLPNEYPEHCQRYVSPVYPDHEEKRMMVDPSTSPTSTFSQDEEMRSPGSADSGCSTDSGCSAESGCSTDSGCSVTSHSHDNYRSLNIQMDDHRDSIVEESMDDNQKFIVKRKTLVDQDKCKQSSSWHTPQRSSEAAPKESVLRKALEKPSKLSLGKFSEYYVEKNLQSHPHKKFRPVLNGSTHETLDGYSMSSSSSCYSNSPSPSSSISSSPSRVSSSPYSNPSSPASGSILAQRLSSNSKKYPHSSPLLQSLTQEPKFSSRTVLSDTLHACIMNGQSRIPRQHVMVAPSPSRYDNHTISSPMQSSSINSSPSHLMNTSSPPPLRSIGSPHGYSSPPLHISHIPAAHSPPCISTPSGLGASAMSGCPSYHQYDDSQPLNLSTKTPSPPPAMEA